MSTQPKIRELKKELSELTDGEWREISEYMFQKTVEDSPEWLESFLYEQEFGPEDW